MMGRILITPRSLSRGGHPALQPLVDAGFDVHVPRDAVVSRSKGNWRNGLQLIGAAGGLVTNTEAALFDLLGEARGEDFKLVSRLIR